MLLTTVNGQEFEICESWHDVTIEKAVELYNVKLPEKLADIYKVMYYSPISQEEKVAVISDLQGKITDEDLYKHFPSFYAKVLEILSDIPHDIIKKTDVISVKSIYITYLQKFVEGVMFFPEFDYSPIKSFRFRDVEYFLPVSREVFGVDVPMVDVTALEFTESADMLSAVSSLQKDISKLATLVAILCRPQGEAYDEQTTIQRTKEFQDLPMDVVWSVFFSLAVPLIIWQQSAAMYSLRKVAAN